MGAVGPRTTRSTTSCDVWRRSPTLNSSPAPIRLKSCHQAIDPDRELTVDEFREHCFGDERATVSDEYVEAFIEGAQELFSEIADQL